MLTNSIDYAILEIDEIKQGKVEHNCLEVRRGWMVFVFFSPFSCDIKMSRDALSNIFVKIKHFQDKKTSHFLCLDVTIHILYFLPWLYKDVAITFILR